MRQNNRRGEGVLWPLAGLLAAAAFVFCLAGLYEAALMRSALTDREVAAR
jgi:hypothetical protein